MESGAANEEKLWSTPTNSADDSKGFSFGLQGDLFIPVVISATVSAMLLTLILMSGVIRDLVQAVLVAGIPFFLVLGYVLLLKQNRPPHFDVDLIEEFILGGDGFERSPVQPEHPRVLADVIERKAREAKEKKVKHGG